MRRCVFIILCLCATMGLTRCADSGDTDNGGVPLPKAWPRINVTVGDSMTRVPGLPVEVLVNSTARAEVLETWPPGLTVHYPGADTYIYYTFIEAPTPRDAETIIRMRKERISLNLNGTAARTLHAASETTDQSTPYDAVMVVANSATRIPVQLLASRPGWVVSATAFIDNPGSTNSFDSVRPLYEVLQHDMGASLPPLKF